MRIEKKEGNDDDDEANGEKTGGMGEKGNWLSDSESLFWSNVLFKYFIESICSCK